MGTQTGVATPWQQGTHPFLGGHAEKWQCICHVDGIGATYILSSHDAVASHLSHLAPSNGRFNKAKALRVFFSAVTANLLFSMATGGRKLEQKLFLC